MKKIILLIFFLFFFSKSFSENYNFIKLADLETPWGSSFINNDEILLLKKKEKLKLLTSPPKM